MADYVYKEETTNAGMSPVTVAFLGAIAGAVGTGVAMALSNPKNRQKVQKTMKDGQKWMNQTINNVKSTASDMQDKVSDKADKLADKADKMSTKLDQGTQEAKTTPETRRTTLR